MVLKFINYKKFNWTSFVYGIILGVTIAIILMVILHKIINYNYFCDSNNNFFRNKSKRITKVNSNTVASNIANDDLNINLSKKITTNKLKSELHNNYEFYNLLANNYNINEITNHKKSIKESKHPNKYYILEIGNFKQISTADELKAKLALIGIESKIQIINDLNPINNNKLTTFKLIIGPFDLQSTAIFQRNKLFQNGIKNVVIKNL